MYLSTLTSSLVQIAVFTLIPFSVYVLTRRRVKGFWEYIGMKPASKRVVVTGALFGLITAGLMLWLFAAPGLRQLMVDPSTQTGRLNALLDEAGVLAWLFVALVQALLTTALAEEILFRGFVAKRFIAWRGFALGNLLQAVLFGVVHLAMLLSTDAPLTLARWLLVLLLPTFQGWVMGWLNERYGKGSAAPSWAAHAAANLFTFIAVPLLW